MPATVKDNLIAAKVEEQHNAIRAVAPNISFSDRQRILFALSELGATERESQDARTSSASETKHGVTDSHAHREANRVSGDSSRPCVAAERNSAPTDLMRPPVATLVAENLDKLFADLSKENGCEERDFLFDGYFNNHRLIVASLRMLHDRAISESQ